MLMFLLAMADEAYRAHIERLFRRYHAKMLRIAKLKFARAE